MMTLLPSIVSKSTDNLLPSLAFNHFSMKKSKSLILSAFLFSCIQFISLKANAASETLSSGSFIINMGVTPQTIANGLKPYGMVYDLVKNYNIQIKWVINSSKIKDGIDFSHNGIDYRGGPFIVPAEFRSSAVNARITYWQGQGVVGATTVSPITVEVYSTLQAMPTWTLDDQNGSIAQGYLTNAGIPASAYNFLAPASLTCCNDLFIMPHADPTWAVHGNLYAWNLDCDGAIWLACHAGSAMHDLFNPSNKAQQMNFLSNKTGNATGAGPYEENSLVLWGNHGAGSPPYTHDYPTDPIMQFMGTIDAATQNGSEQIYLPKTTWRSGAKVYVWDPTQADVPSKSPGPAAVMVSGRGLDDPNRGRVMLEAGHSHNKATAPANIAAQRAFFNFSFISTTEKAVIPILSSVPDTMYSNKAYNLSFSLPPGHNTSDYTILWSSSCGGTFSPNNQVNTTFTPATASYPTGCILSVKITDACSRSFTGTKSYVTGCNLLVSSTTTKPLCKGNSNGSIGLTITNGSAPYSYNWSRVSPSGTGSGTGTTISGLSAGTYNITVTSTGGCTKSITVNLSEPALLSATTSLTNVLCFGASTGAITLTVTGGTPGYTYNWGGGITTQNRSNIPAGSYTVTVTDANACTTTATATITQPSSAISATATPTNVKCYGASTGSISLTVSGGTPSYTYNWSNGASTQNISSIPSGSYTVTVTDANGCLKTASATVTQPSAALSLSATMVNVSCNGGSNASIDLSVSGGTSPYTYLWSNSATTQDISSLSAGTYSVTVTDANLCTQILSKTITQPAVLSLSVNKVNATCPNTTDGSIDLSVSGGTPAYSYAWSNGATTQDLSGLLPGTYSVTVTDANGCTKNTSVTIINTNPFPTTPVTINKN
jgi:hypothetical protein